MEWHKFTKIMVLSMYRDWRPVLLYYKESTVILNGLRVIVLHQNTKETEESVVSSTQKYQVSVIKASLKDYLKTL